MKVAAWKIFKLRGKSSLPICDFAFYETCINELKNVFVIVIRITIYGHKEN